jgi:hypothetical protein
VLRVAREKTKRKSEIHISIQAKEQEFSKITTQYNPGTGWMLAHPSCDSSPAGGASAERGRAPSLAVHGWDICQNLKIRSERIKHGQNWVMFQFVTGGFSDNSYLIGLLLVPIE